MHLNRKSPQTDWITLARLRNDTNMIKRRFLKEPKMTEEEWEKEWKNKWGNGWKEIWQNEWKEMEESDE